MKCNYCGCEETIIGDGRVWCANGQCGAELGKARFGLIEGRHEMPVDGYLLPANITESVGFHEGVYKAAKEAAKNQAMNGGDFTLYPTGLTVAAIGAVDGMREAGITNPTVRNFDNQSKQYVEFPL